jgi:glutamate-1-semialdehyde 2,1-aminomutase
VATIERLMKNDGELYASLDEMGARLQTGIESIGQQLGQELLVSRIGSALCLYFMDHVPVDWHDLAHNHDFACDTRMRQELIEAGIYVFPLAAKQWSISAAHTTDYIDRTVQAFGRVMQTAASAV